MKKVKINFCDFWKGFQPTDNYFVALLSQKFEVKITAKPDYLIYSSFGKEHRNYECVKIFYTGENKRPKFKECDFAFTFDYLDQPNHYRLPLYALYTEPEALIKNNKKVTNSLQKNRKFCNFVYSNRKADPFREHFFHKLSQYKKVDSGGGYLNNTGKAIGPSVTDKLNFIQQYKFTIAFENSSYPGYTTEKIIHPMLVNSIPIYWGNPLVDRDFNPKSFLNYYDYPDEDALIQRIITVDQNEELYRKYLFEPYYHRNQINSFIHPDNVLNQLCKIFGSF